MEKKYKTKKEGSMLRIIALKDFAEFEKGQLGGLIEKEENLSQEGNCWIYPDAKVYGDARVYDNAWIEGNAQVYGEARIYDNAMVSGIAIVCGSARVYENARVYDNAYVSDNAMVSGWSEVCEFARVFGDVWVYGEAYVSGNAEVRGNVKLHSPLNKFCIANFIENSKDYVILVAIRKDFCIFSSDIGDVADFATTARHYLKNIETIRQLYEEKV